MMTESGCDESRRKMVHEVILFQEDCYRCESPDQCGKLNIKQLQHLHLKHYKQGSFDMYQFPYLLPGVSSCDFLSHIHLEISLLGLCSTWHKCGRAVL